MNPTLDKFEAYCKPRKNTPFAASTVVFRRLVKRTISIAVLRQLAEGCDFATITPDEILRDRLVFGILDGETAQ